MIIKNSFSNQIYSVQTLKVTHTQQFLTKKPTSFIPLTGTILYNYFIEN